MELPSRLPERRFSSGPGRRPEAGSAKSGGRAWRRCDPPSCVEFPHRSTWTRFTPIGRWPPVSLPAGREGALALRSGRGIFRVPATVAKRYRLRARQPHRWMGTARPGFGPLDAPHAHEVAEGSRSDSPRCAVLPRGPLNGQRTRGDGTGYSWSRGCSGGPHSQSTLTSSSRRMAAPSGRWRPRRDPRLSDACIRKAAFPSRFAGSGTRRDLALQGTPLFGSLPPPKGRLQPPTPTLELDPLVDAPGAPMLPRPSPTSPWRLTGRGNGAPTT